MNTIKTPSKSLLNRLQHEIVEQDEYKLKHLRNYSFDYVIDIGANIGVFSLHAFNLLTVRKLFICVEPQINNFVHLRLNVKNIIPNIQLYNAALGDGSDLYLTTNPKNEGMYQCLKEPVTKETIRSLTLSHMINDNKIKTSDKVLLKCDCEGCEASLMNDEAMSHMKHFLQISLEVHYGDKYFKYCPSKEKYKLWLKTFTNHMIYSQNWNSDKNGRVILLKKD